MLTLRGWAGLATGMGTLGVVWGFGALALLPLAVALILGPLAARALIGWGYAESLRLRIQCSPERPLEGQPVVVSVVIDGRLPRNGIAELRLAGRSHHVTLSRQSATSASGNVVIDGLARGHYPIRGASITAGDPFGFAAFGRAAVGGDALVVWPRWVEQGRVASARGGDGNQRARARLAQSVGYDLHGVREHQDGESLRRVDWKTSARTGRLMVRELEDASRIDQVIVLDMDRALVDAAVGDQLMRIAATLVRAAISQGQQASLLLAGATPLTLPLDGSAAAWDNAMDALAAAQATREGALVELFAADQSIGRGRAFTIVTASHDVQLVDRIVRESRRTSARVIVVAGHAASAAAWSQFVLAGGHLDVLGPDEHLETLLGEVAA